MSALFLPPAVFSIFTKCKHTQHVYLWYSSLDNEHYTEMRACKVLNRVNGRCPLNQTYSSLQHTYQFIKRDKSKLNIIDIYYFEPSAFSFLGIFP